MYIMYIFLWKTYLLSTNYIKIFQKKWDLNLTMWFYWLTVIRSGNAPSELRILKIILLYWLMTNYFTLPPLPSGKNVFRLFNTEVQNGDNKRLTKKHLVKGFTKLMTIIRFPQIFKHFIRNKCIIIYVKTIFFK